MHSNIDFQLGLELIHCIYFLFPTNNEMGNLCLKEKREFQENQQKKCAVVTKALIKIQKEYEVMCKADAKLVERDAERYNIIKDTIRFLPIEDQAQYADYAIQRLTAETAIDILLPYLMQHARTIPECYENYTPTSIGNTAKLLMTLPNTPFKSEAIMKFRSALHASF